MKVLHKASDIEAIGATVVFVVHDEPARVRDGLLAGLEVGFPVLLDEERGAYDRWGMERVGWGTVWLDPRVWLRYARLLLSGERWRGLGGDTGQLGGDFVVDADGVVTYARPQRRDDRPPVAELVAELRRATGDGL